MSQNDDSLLNAYLDGELDERRSWELELALRSDPALRARLAEGRRLGRLVAELARPAAPAGVPEAVLARIEAEKLSPFPRGSRPARVLGLGIVLAAAAVLFVALLVLPNRGGVSPRPGGESGPVMATTGGERSDGGVGVGEGRVVEPVPAVAEHGLGSAPRLDVPVASVPAPSQPVSEAVAKVGPALPAEAAVGGSIDAFLTLVSGPADQSRITVAGVEGRAVDAEAVERLIRESRRAEPRYGRLAATMRGDGPGFVLIGDRMEVDQLLKRLREAFGDEAVKIEAADRSVLARLAEAPAGEVTLGRGEKALPRVETPELLHSQKVDDELVEPPGTVPPGREKTAPSDPGRRKIASESPMVEFVELKPPGPETSKP